MSPYYKESSVITVLLKPLKIYFVYCAKLHISLLGLYKYGVSFSNGCSNQQLQRVKICRKKKCRTFRKFLCRLSFYIKMQISMASRPFVMPGLFRGTRRYIHTIFVFIRVLLHHTMRWPAFGNRKDISDYLLYRIMWIILEKLAYHISNIDSYLMTLNRIFRNWYHFVD